MALEIALNPYGEWLNHSTTNHRWAKGRLFVGQLAKLQWATLKNKYAKSKMLSRWPLKSNIWHLCSKYTFNECRKAKWKYKRAFKVQEIHYVLEIQGILFDSLLINMENSLYISFWFFQKFRNSTIAQTFRRIYVEHRFIHIRRTNEFSSNTYILFLGGP